MKRIKLTKTLSAAVVIIIATFKTYVFCLTSLWKIMTNICFAYRVVLARNNLILPRVRHILPRVAGILKILSFIFTRFEYP